MSTVASQISSSIQTGGGDSAAAPAPAASAPDTGVTQTSEGQGVTDQPGADTQGEAGQPDFSKQFNALTKREKMLVEREAQIKEESQSLKQYRDDLAVLEKNPIEFLGKHGFEPKQIADFLLGGGNKKGEGEGGEGGESSKVEQLMKRLDDMESQRKEELENAKKSKKQQQEEATINNFKENIKKTVGENAEKYEILESMGQHDLVYEVIEQHHKETGEILDIDKAAESVENYLESQLEKIAGTSKFKTKFSSIESNEPETKPAHNPVQPRNNIADTLTNQDVSRTPKPRAENHLSREESISSAAALLQKSLDAKKYGKPL